MSIFKLVMFIYKDNKFVQYVYSLMTDKNKVKELLNIIQQLNNKDAGQKIIIYGIGSNGKSTFVQILTTIFNDKIKYQDNIKDIGLHNDNIIVVSNEFINIEKGFHSYYKINMFHFNNVFRDTNFKITDELIEDAHKFLNYSPLIIKYNLINDDKFDKIIFINANEEDIYQGQMEYREFNNNIIVFNGDKKRKVNLSLNKCYNSTFEIDNIDTLTFIDCRDNTFIIGPNVRSIVANDIGAGPKRPDDDLLSNNFKFYRDYIINIDQEI